jgi:3-phenylpropionate/trans-cinnamate dioxygenase ferredoxin reductase subunit
MTQSLANPTHRDIRNLAVWNPITSVQDGGFLAGKVGEQRVIVIRLGCDLFAFGTTCPHLGAPLDEGLIADGVLRCPWHHARFDLRTGEALCAPAFDALARYQIEKRHGDFAVRSDLAKPRRSAKASSFTSPGPMVIVGGGAAGFSAADALRREGWGGKIVLISAEREQPYDRTLLTKDYLEGAFGDDRLPIARQDLASLNVKFESGVRVGRIDIARARLDLAGGGAYGKLLLATGAAPVKLKAPGAELPHVVMLRSLADCRRVLSRLPDARRIVIIGGSFIALEAAASLRSRGLEVAVIAPERQPMSKVFGGELSDLVVKTHRSKGVNFYLGGKVIQIDQTSVELDDGHRLDADLVIVGIGVKPRLDLAHAAGLAIDRGVTVGNRMQTSVANIFAAGDIARWPDPLSGERIRVEHWVVAERQGEAAAANMLGIDKPFDAPPFFWTKHFDLSILYVGHAKEWDQSIVEGDVSKRNATVRFIKNGRDAAIATVGRDLDNLRAELLFERKRGGLPADPVGRRP